MGRIAGKVPDTDDFTLAVVGTGFLDSGLTLQRFENSSSGASLLLGHSRNGTIGSSTILQDGDELGKIRFYADDGTNMDHHGGEIKVIIDGTPGTNDIPSSMIFGTASNGASSATERWRITSDGHFRAATNGNGIDFSATEGSGASSSILSDYEEGTFVPTLSVSTIGSLSIDSTSDTCSYVKIGNLVTCIGSIGINGSGGSGTLRLTNFPFAMNTGLTEEAELSAVTCNIYNTATDASGLINAEMSNVSGDATLLIRDGGGKTTGVQSFGNHLGASTVIRFSAIYRTS